MARARAERGLGAGAGEAEPRPLGAGTGHGKRPMRGGEGKTEGLRPGSGVPSQPPRVRGGGDGAESDGGEGRDGKAGSGLPDQRGHEKAPQASPGGLPDRRDDRLGLALHLMEDFISAGHVGIVVGRPFDRQPEIAVGIEIGMRLRIAKAGNPDADLVEAGG